MHASQMNDVEEAGAGEIAAMFGVDCSSGDTFTDGEISCVMSAMYVAEPVMELAIYPKEKDKLVNLSKALNRFRKEDPTFHVRYDEESSQTIIRGMGELHLEIYIERIRREYNCEVEIGKPKVAFRETILKKSEFNYTHKKQTGGSGQFARIAGFIEPLPEGHPEPYEFVDKIFGGAINREYIPAIDKGFQEQLEEGVLIKQPVLGVRALINDGATHSVDSSEMAFKVAAKSAMREALKKASPIILEPIMKLEVSAPDEFQGTIIGQINQRRGIILNSSAEGGYVVVESEIPLKEMFGYASVLRGATQGKGEFTMEFLKYQQLPRGLQEELIEEYRKAEK
jgi:elongation factor G